MQASYFLAFFLSSSSSTVLYQLCLTRLVLAILSLLPSPYTTNSLINLLKIKPTLPHTSEATPAPLYFMGVPVRGSVPDTSSLHSLTPTEGYLLPSVMLRPTTTALRCLTDRHLVASTNPTPSPPPSFMHLVKLVSGYCCSASYLISPHGTR